MKTNKTNKASVENETDSTANEAMKNITDLGKTSLLESERKKKVDPIE